MTENNSRYPLVPYVTALQEEMPELDATIVEGLLNDGNEERFLVASHDLYPTSLKF